MDLDLNGTEGQFSLGLEVAVSSVVVLSIATIVGTLGNVLLLVVIATAKGFRTAETVLVINLALSDLYVTSIADPMGIIAKFYGAEFFERIPGLCQTVASMCTISCVSSLMTIALMSVNRYFYICRHDTYRAIFTYRNVILMCMSLYLIGTFLVLLNQAGIGDHSFDHKSFECIWDRMATFPYTVVFSVTLVWIPTLITGACYLRIYMFVSAHRRKIRQQTADNDDHHHSARAPRLRKLHLAKTLCTIYAVFATCWIPYALLIVVDSNDDFPHEVHVYITMFAHLHPSLNWMIYYATNKKFSNAYKQLYNRCFGSCFVIGSSTDDVTPSTRACKETLNQITETTTHSHSKEIVEGRMVLEDVVESDFDSNKRQRGTDDAASAI